MAHSVEEDKVPVIAKKYGWDLETTRTKIRMTQEILQLMHPIDAIEFLLATKAEKRTICDGCNVLLPFEHRCHGNQARVNDVKTGKACQCPDCFVMENLVTG